MDVHTAGGWVALAKERGIQTKALNMAFITLAKQTEKLAEGNKTATKAFDQLGISAKQWAGLNTEQRMERLADAFQKMRDPAQRAALAQTLFGRGAQTMIPLLSKGRDALRAQIAEQARAAGENNHSLREQMKLVAEQREMNRAMLQLKVAVATALMPIMIAFGQLIAPLTAGFAKLMQGSTGFRIAVVALTAGIITFIVIAKALALAGLEVDAAWLLIPAALVLLGVALVMLYQKCAWFRAAVQAVMHGVVAAFNWVKEAAVNVFDWIKSHWVLIASLLGGPFVAVTIQIVKHWGQIQSAAETAFNAVKGAVETVASVISSVFGGALRGVTEVAEKLWGVLGKVFDVAHKIMSAPGDLVKKGLGLVGIGQTGLYTHEAGTALVGEQGPEMVHLPQGARVSPFVQSYSGGGGAGQVVVPVYLDRRQIALAMGSFVADRQAAS
jgi:hypothetical protein